MRTQLARRALGPGEGMVLVGLSFLLLPLVGGPLQAKLGLGGIALSELLLVLAPALLGLYFARVSPVAAVQLQAPSPQALAAAAIAGAGAFYLVAAGLSPLQERLIPMPEALQRQLQQLLLSDSAKRPLIVDVLALAVTPAVCEEVLFRGVLLRSLVAGTAVDRRLALLVTSLAFGAFHYSPYKFVPTAVLGLVLGAIALRSSSLWPAVLAHALNNTLVVLLVRAGFLDPPGTGAKAAPLYLLIAAAATATGLFLMRPRPCDSDSRAPLF